jgi:hypothetical protein
VVLCCPIVPSSSRPSQLPYPLRSLPAASEACPFPFLDRPPQSIPSLILNQYAGSLHTYTKHRGLSPLLPHGLVKLRVSYRPPDVDIRRRPTASSPECTHRQAIVLLRAPHLLKMRQCLRCHDADDSPSSDGYRPKDASRRQKQTRFGTKSAAVLAVLASSLPSTTMAQQSCVSLQGSTVCPAFDSASIDTNQTGNLYVRPQLWLAN